jgi:hypothetical protein
MIYFRKDYFDNSKTFDDFVEAAQWFFNSSDAEDTCIYNSDNDVWVTKNAHTFEHPGRWEVHDQLLCKSYFTNSLEEAMDCMFSLRRA